MADTSSRIRIIFDGAVEGLRRAVRAAEQDLNRLNDGFDRNRETLDTFERASNRVTGAVAAMTRGFLLFGGAAAGLQSVVAVTATLVSVTAQLAPAALALPGIFLGVAVAAGTLKLGLSGVADAFKQGAAGAKAFAQLSTEAKAFVTATKSLKPAFDDLKHAVQNDLFAGLAIEIKETGAALLQVGSKGLPNVAAGFNAMAVAALRAMRTPFFRADLTKIIDNTSKALFNMEFTVASVVSGFVGLGAVGSKYLPAIGKAIDGVAAKFSQWVDKGVESGAIERMIDRAIQGFKDLGDAVRLFATAANVGFAAFNRGLNGQGGTIESIKAAAGALLDFVNQPQIMDGLTALGEIVRVLSDTFRTVLAAALKEIGPILREIATFVQELARQISFALVGAINTVGPLLQGLARFLSANKDAIAPIVPLLFPLALGFKAVGLAIAGIRGLAALTAAFTAIQAVLGGGLAARLALVASALAPILIPVAAVVGVGLFAKYLDEVNIAAAGGDPAKLTGIARALHEVIVNFEQLGNGDFKGIVDDFNADLARLGNGDAPISDIWRKISTSFQRDLIEPLSAGALKIRDSFQRDFLGFFERLPGIVGESLASLGTSLSTFAQPVITFFTNLPTTIGTALSGLGQMFSMLAQSVWTSFLGGLTTAFGPVLAFFSQTPFQMGFQIGAGIGSFVQVGIDLWNNFLLGCQTGIQGVLAFCASVPGLIAAAITGVVQTVTNVAVLAWTGFLTTSVNVINQAVSFFSQLPTRASSAIGGIVGVVVKIAVDTWTGFLTTSTNLINQAVSFIGQLPGRAVAAIVAIVALITRVAVDTWNGFRNSTTTGANAVLTFIGTLPGKIVSTLSGLVGQMQRIGSDAIAGFGRGITSGFNAITSAVSNFVSGLIAGARAKLQVNSPSKVFMAIGSSVGEGMQRGIDRSAGGAIAAVTQLTSAMARAGAAVDTSLLTSFESAQLARSQQLAAQNAQVGDLITQVTGRTQSAPVVNVTVELSQAQIEEIARVQIDNNSRAVARRVAVGAGATF